MRYVLFVCTHNAGRSQMAEAFFEKYAPSDLRAECGWRSFSLIDPLPRERA